MDKTIVNTYLQKLKELSCHKGEDVGAWQYRTAEYIEPEKHTGWSEWKQLTGYERLPSDKTIFLETTFKFPESIIEDGDKKDYLFINFINGEGILKVDGETYHGIDSNRDRIPLRAEWAGQEKTLSIELFGYATRKNKSDTSFVTCHLGRIDKRIEKYYFDLMLAWDTYNMDNEIIKKMWNNLDGAQKVINNSLTGFVKSRLIKAIDLSLQYLDINLNGENLISAVMEADKILLEEIKKIDDGSQKGHVSLIGHTHIDVAWLWQLKDTVRKCGHTFSNMIRLMEEYPEFTFSCSQPQLYEYTKEYYPEIYEQIKKYVKEGRWEIVGPMWVESDCNVISGESLVRQILYGREFFLKEFGKISDICWLPDVFGFQANMPQILKKSGVNSFYSYKLHWQAQNRFPYGSFKWKGIDGSEVIASVPELYSGYNGQPFPSEIKYAQDQNLQKEYLDDVIFTYGWGDGGGGPTHEMVECVKRMENYPGIPNCTMDKAADFFKLLKEKEHILPVWYGELYLETHRGTLTSQGYAKKMNRKAENLYQQVEKLAIMAGVSDKAINWERFKEGWRKILLLQFHDILPGSSIGEVYEDSEVIYNEIINIGKQAVSQISENLAGEEKEKLPEVVTVANTLSWNRSDVVILDIEEKMKDIHKANEDNPLVVETIEGQPVPSEVISETAADGNSISKLVFLAENIPSMGFKSFKIKRGKTTKETSLIEVKTSGLGIQNSFFDIELDLEGRIVRLFDKEKGRMVISQPANDFRLFLDGPQSEDAWNIYESYKERKLDYKWDTSIDVLENNSIRTIINVKKSHEKVTINQNIIIYSRNRRIDFKTIIDWQERNKVLKVAFPVEINVPYAAYEVGFGTLLRPTILNNPFEKSKFEVSAHKWVDLSEGEYGVSLMNDSKYGHDVEENTMSITLLRGTTSPDPKADIGIHEITYSLYPHIGDWREALTARYGHELNHPVLILDGQVDKAFNTSFLEIDNPNIIVDTIKQAEDGRGVIVRLYECNGNRGTGIITINMDIETALETNLIEEDIQPAKWDGKNLYFKFEPYEIKTFRVIPKS